MRCGEGLLGALRGADGLRNAVKSDWVLRGAMRGRRDVSKTAERHGDKVGKREREEKRRERRRKRERRESST